MLELEGEGRLETRGSDGALALLRSMWDWPLPPLHLGSRMLRLGSQGSCATDVELVATWYHPKQLSVEIILIHLSLRLHVADTDFLQMRVAGKRLFGFHYLFHDVTAA